MMVQLGELFAGRQALEAAEIAPGTLPTLQALRDPSRRPPRPREDIPQELLEFEPITPLELDEGSFSKNLRSARKGAAAGPSGMTTDHLRPLLDNVRDLHMLFLVGEQLATGKAPHEVVETVRMGRLPALTKPNGGIRGIVSGDVVRRLVSRTIAQQVGEVVEGANWIPRQQWCLCMELEHSTSCPGAPYCKVCGLHHTLFLSSGNSTAPLPLRLATPSHKQGLCLLGFGV